MTETERTLHPRHGVHAPIASTPRRAPRSLRRTATTDLVRPDGLGGELVMTGRARDLWTDARGDAHVLDTASYEARVGTLLHRDVLAVHTEPERPAAAALVGVRASGGFRAALDRALPDERDARSLLYLLLDDLPVAALVSGYAVTYAIDVVIPKEHRPSQRPDLCAGWRAGGTMLAEQERTGRVPISVGPDAPPLARDGDPLAWHPLPPLPVHAMRRHRRLDVVPRGGALELDVHFRDSHRNPNGRETLVHEYGMTVRVDPDSLAITSLDARAGALPWIECNSALPSASRLVGRPVAALRSHVRAAFSGPTTCTHLNDTLRSLEDLATLAGVATRLAREP